MPTVSEDITNAVEESLGALIGTFRGTPTLFFTENDLVCWLVADLIARLGDRGQAIGKGDVPHRLVHTEYPTPFRCRMSGGGFAIMGDDDRTEKNGGYRRGHLDVVVLNPAFVARHTYDELKAQNYAVFRKDVWAARREGEPMLLYAIEFYLSRDRIASAEGGKRCAREIMQDADKLGGASREAYAGFAAMVRHVAFLKGTVGERRREIEGLLRGRDEITAVFAD